MRIPRREMLFRCLATGALTSLLPADQLIAAMLEAERLAPTPHASKGPFWRRGAPGRRRIAPDGAAGMPLEVQGRVLDTRGQAIPGARIELWHASHEGEYDLQGFDYRGHIASEASGGYGYESVVPGHYPGRLAQHVHYLVTAPGHRELSTQLYFATDPAFEGSPEKTYRKDPIITSATLIRPVNVERRGEGVLARVSFEIVLERA